MKVSVEKLSNNKNLYRTPLTQIDVMPEKPQVGNRLILLSTTFESGGIITSEVKEVNESDESFVVKTEFSTYLITKIKD